MRGNPIKFSNFSAGLNTMDGPYLVTTGECRDCSNVTSTARGSIVRRNGVATFADAPSSTSYNSLFALETAVGSAPRKSLVAVCDAAIYAIDGVGARVTLKTGVSSGVTWEFCSYPGTTTPGAPAYAFGMNGTNTPQKFIGDTTLSPASNAMTDWVATVGTVPNGRYAVQWQERLWVAGVSGKGSSLYYSGVGDAYNWPTANVADIFDSADGEDITGLATVGAYLLVFKRSKVWVVYDVDVDLGPLKRVVSRNIGTCSHRSVVETPNATLFLTPDKGVWSTDGSTVRDLSAKVGPSFNIDPSIETNACAAYWNNHYYVSIPTLAHSSAGDDVLMDYDMQLQSWWKHTVPAQQLVTWRKTTNGASLLYGIRALSRGSSTLPGIDVYFGSTQVNDNGFNFASSWTSAWHAFDVPHIRKRLRRMVFDGSGLFNTFLSTDFSTAWYSYATLSLSVASDSYAFGAVGGPVFGSGGIFGGSASAISKSVYGIGGDVAATPPKTALGKTISIKFEGSSPNGMTVNAYTMSITPRKN